VRTLSRMVAEAYFESRKALGFPLATPELRQQYLD
jgi:glycyl-tRNA synthetase alpha subunit